MKKKYEKPTTLLVAGCITHICAGSAKWHVDAPDGEHDHDENDPDWGYIYTPSNLPDDYDPWDSDNW